MELGTFFVTKMTLTETKVAYPLNVDGWNTILAFWDRHNFTCFCCPFQGGNARMIESY